jgi:hypothetical protein
MPSGGEGKTPLHGLRKRLGAVYGVAMAKSRELDRFCNIPNYVLESEAVRTLQPSHFMVLIYLAMRCYGAKKNGRIVFANRSGCRKLDNSDPEKKNWKWVETPIGSGESGMGKSTIGDALRELERRGLIACTQRSTFGQKRLAQTYRLTWVRTEDEMATNDFRNWRARNSETRPTQRPVGHATGRPTGRTLVSTSSKQAVQAEAPAYAQPYRPTQRPRSYQCNRDVVPALDVDVALAAIAAQVRAASGMMAAEASPVIVACEDRVA